VRERTEQTCFLRVIRQGMVQPHRDALDLVVASWKEAAIDQGRPNVQLDVPQGEAVEQFVRERRLGSGEVGQHLGAARAGEPSNDLTRAIGRAESGT
jgi:hypothetical protein